MVEQPAPDDGDVIAQRYLLEDETGSGPGARTWRARDLRLGRRVSIRFLDGTNPRSDGVRLAAQRAAGVENRYLVPLLDLVEAPGWSGVVAEWTDLPTLGFVARERMPAELALAITMKVGEALTSLADAGIAHGDIRADNVHVDTGGGVRVRGQQVDAAWHGFPADQALLRQRDAQALVAVLFCTLTGRWPAADRLENDDSRQLRPARLVADVPTILDELVARCNREVRAGNLDTRGVVAAVAVARDALRSEPVRRRSSVLTVATRAALIAVGGLALGGLAAAGISAAASRHDTRVAQESVSTSDGVLAANESAAAALGPSEEPLAVARMTTLDPDGDGSEYPHLLTNITDDDPGTAWMTKPYFSADVGGKRGVGVVFDLDEAADVSALALDLIGTSTDFSVYVADTSRPDVSQLEPVAVVRGAGQSVFVRLPRRVGGRYVIVWLQRLSPVASSASSDVGYRGGIRHAAIYGAEADNAR